MPSRANSPVANSSVSRSRQLLRDINDAGTVVVMATHDLDLVRDSGQRILELRDGQLVFDSAADQGAAL